MSFIWCDLETTGLDPQRDEILSLGLIVTDDSMREIARFERDVHVPAGYRAMRDMSDYVRAMHERSGLLQRCADSTLTLPVATTWARAFLTEHLGAPAAEITARPPMAGSSVHFDRSFLQQHSPKLLEHFNYRLLDVSTLKVLAMATVPGARAWNDSRPDAPHTPLADLDGSIAELAHWRGVLGGEREARYREALISIASLSEAPLHQDANGSFDEPGSAQCAREALRLA